jgi:CspA family cold shock protein
MLGRVKFFDGHKGFGFLTPDDGGDDVFVHVTRLANGDVGLMTGDIVEFDCVLNPRRPGKRQATNVRLVGAGGAAAAAADESRQQWWQR